MNKIPFLPSLKTVRISGRVTPCNDSSLHRYIADHARCAILKLWTFYENQPELLGDYDTIPNDVSFDLTVVRIEFWHWATPSAHAKKIGTPSAPHIKKVVFDSMKQGDQLVIRDRDGGKTFRTYYDIYDSFGCSYIDSHDWQKSWFPAEPKLPDQPFILPEWFHDAQRNLLD